MNSKVLKTIQRIVELPNGIADTFVDGNEIYFKYKNHAMSVVDRRDDVLPHGRYSVYFYPHESNTSDQIAEACSRDNSQPVDMVPYHSADFGDDKPFRELYSTVLGAHFHIDSVLDSILN